MRRFFELLGVVLFQLIAILSTTFLVSLLTWTLTDDPETQSANYVLFLGLSISIGVFLAGWLSLKYHWLKSQPLLLPRLAGTVLGAYLPLVIILLIENMIRAGHPVFTITMLTGILGFHLPAWLRR